MRNNNLNSFVVEGGNIKLWGTPQILPQGRKNLKEDTVRFSMEVRSMFQSFFISCRFCLKNMNSNSLLYSALCSIEMLLINDKITISEYLLQLNNFLYS